MWGVLQTGTAVETLVRNAVAEFVRGVVGSLPEVVSGLLFVSVAYVGIRIVLAVLRSVLDRIYPTEQDLVVELFVTVVAVFLWFGVGLTLLKILGMGEIAASLGTATGFVALGVSYALSNMIADTVAGVYLLRDPDYNLGDTVTAAGETGVVRDIGLRKTRIERDDGDRVVVANSKVDAGWVWQAPEAESETTDEAGAADAAAPPATDSPTGAEAGDDAAGPDRRDEEPGDRASDHPDGRSDGEG